MTPRALPIAACLLLCPAALVMFATGDEPPALPDLSVGAGEIRFSIFGEEVAVLSQEYRFVTIGVSVQNSGPGASATANVSFFDNGRFLALVPVRGNLTAFVPGNETRVEFMWYIGDTPTGNRTIRAEASDPAGDAHPADNAAERKITIHGRAPVLAVRFDMASSRANVTATTAGLVTCNGSVVADHNPGPVEITLAASTDNGWACSLNWTALILTGCSPHDFSVTVTVPPAAKNSDIGNLRLSARATADGMSATAETTGLIFVAPYFCLTVGAEPRKVTVGPAENALFKLELRNTGNAVDSYSIEVMNGNALNEQGWSIRLSARSMPKVSPDSSKTFTIDLVQNAYRTPYTDKSVRIDVKVTSLNSEVFQREVYAIFSLIVVQNGFFMPSVGLMCLLVLLAVLVSALAVRSLRHRKKRKTVADYNRELHLDE